MNRNGIRYFLAGLIGAIAGAIEETALSGG
jgi:hypothetical protein